jgi:phosphoenolpyruvate carboxylase
VHRVAPWAAGALLLGALAACGGKPVREESVRMSPKSIQDVLAAHNDSLLRIPGVVGTAIGVCDGAPCIRVFVADSDAAKRTGLAPKLDGYPLRVEVSGIFRPRPSG